MTRSKPSKQLPVYQLVGDGSKEFAAIWDKVMDEVYDDHEIKNANQLAETTGISVTAINNFKGVNAYSQPHMMTYGLFERICAGLEEDANWIEYRALRFYELSIEGSIDAIRQFYEIKESLTFIARKFITFDRATQKTIVQMISGIQKAEEYTPCCSASVIQRINSQIDLYSKTASSKEGYSIESEMEILEEYDSRRNHSFEENMMQGEILLTADAKDTPLPNIRGLIMGAISYFEDVRPDLATKFDEYLDSKEEWHF